MREVISTLAVLCVALQAHAQVVPPDQAEIGLTVNTEELSFSDIECTARAAEELTFKVTLPDGKDFGEYELRLTYATSSAGCSKDVVEECEASSPDGAGTFSEVECRCIKAVQNQREFTFKEALTSHRMTGAGTGEDICAAVEQDTELKLYFVAIWEPTGDDVEDDDGDNAGLTRVESTPIIFTIDRSGPPAPPKPPRVAASEQALKVTVTEAPAVDDIATYEACARPVSERQPLGDAASEVCETTTAKDDLEDIDPIKISGLDNGTCYCVLFRAIDAAGNKGSFSPADCCTQPEALLDFAELYATRGGLERGGCDVSGRSGSALLVGVLALLGLARRRRR